MSLKRYRQAAILIALFSFSTGLGDVRADLDPSQAKVDQKLVEANTQFALDLYAQMSKDAGKENIFFSPLSLSAILAQSHAGARGNTAKEMKETLHFDLEPAQLHPAMSAFLKDLQSPKEMAAYQLNIANALWVEQTYGLLPEFASLCQNNYEAAIRAVDFKTAAEVQRKTINDWTAEHTNNKIKDLLSPGAVDSQTRLVLTNAIYFKGNWKQQFDRAKTRDEAFKLGDGKTIQAPMMGQENHFRYWAEEALQILEMPYAGEALSMVILLPSKVDGLADLEKSLNAKTLGGWFGKLHKEELYVALPRFTMTASYRLDAKLRALGMREAFTPKADFSGVDGTKELFVTTVVHKAFVDVNEEGTEAAAASHLAEAKKAAPPSFLADHPFLFLIRDMRTGSILFLGRVLNPKG